MLPIEQCYAIHWKQHNMFFKEEFLDEAMILLNNSIIAHVWNRLSSKAKLYKTSNSAYMQLAKQYCPKTFELSAFF